MHKIEDAKIENIEYSEIVMHKTEDVDIENTEYSETVKYSCTRKRMQIQRIQRIKWKGFYAMVRGRSYKETYSRENR